MDLLVIEPLESEVMQWLESRHAVRFAPELAREPRALRQALYNVRAIIAPPSAAIDAQTLHYAPLLRAVGRVSAGAENIDLDACARAGVEVVRSLTATAQAEAEFMIGAMLSMLRRVPVVGSDGMLVGRELGAATVGLVGMPPAARAMSQILAAFGSKVVGYDPSLHASDSVWERLGLLGDRFLPFCKPNQVIVSTSHSALFDEAALAGVLSSGRVAAAWLDSLEPGALDSGRPLAGISTLQITPRVASTTRESRLRSAWAVARRIDELLATAPQPQREFRPTEPGVPADLADGPVST